MKAQKCSRSITLLFI